MKQLGEEDLCTRLDGRVHDCIRLDGHKGKCIVYHNVRGDGEMAHGQFHELSDEGTDRFLRIVIALELKPGEQLTRLEAAAVYEYMNYVRRKRMRRRLKQRRSK